MGTTSDSVVDFVDTQGARPPSKHPQCRQGLVRIQLWMPTLPSQPSRSASEVRRIDATVRNVTCDIGIIGNLRRVVRRVHDTMFGFPV